jgi:hypothetical protein
MTLFLCVVLGKWGLCDGLSGSEMSKCIQSFRINSEPEQVAG